MFVGRKRNNAKGQSIDEEERPLPSMQPSVTASSNRTHSNNAASTNKFRISLN
jgi:hypothetical protein